MRDHLVTAAAAIVLLGLAFVVAERVAFDSDSAVPRDVALTPGESVEFMLGESRMTLNVPRGRGESASIGTFRVREASGAFDSGPLLRDGAVETLFIDDVNDDHRDDAVIVVRSAGSGSYVSLFVIASGAAGYSAIALPEPSPSLVPGYQGHDTVVVLRGRIHRRFPTYFDDYDARINRQWLPADLVKDGMPPFRARPDSNASPSGPDRAISYSFATGRWNAG